MEIIDKKIIKDMGLDNTVNQFICDTGGIDLNKICLEKYVSTVLGTSK